MQLKHWFARGLTILCATALVGCNSPAGARRETRSLPGAREIVITTVPLLTRELAQTYSFLKPDFAKGGVLDGKEVYSFEPNSITVLEGDTLHLTFISPSSTRG
jgi:hypothetical protein